MDNWNNAFELEQETEEQINKQPLVEVKARHSMDIPYGQFVVVIGKRTFVFNCSGPKVPEIKVFIGVKNGPADVDWTGYKTETEDWK